MAYSSYHVFKLYPNYAQCNYILNKFFYLYSAKYHSNAAAYSCRTKRRLEKREFSLKSI